MKQFLLIAVVLMQSLFLLGQNLSVSRIFQIGKSGDQPSFHSACTTEGFKFFKTNELEDKAEYYYTSYNEVGKANDVFVYTLNKKTKKVTAYYRCASLVLYNEFLEMALADKVTILLEKGDQYMFSLKSDPQYIGVINYTSTPGQQSGTSSLYVYKKDQSSMPVKGPVAFYDNTQKKYGFFNQSQNLVVEPKYEYMPRFYGGYAVVKSGGKYGIIDTTGKEVIKMVYDDARNFSEGMACVALKDSNSTKPRWGFVDKTGNVVIPFKYENAYSFIEGMASVARNGKYGFIDKTGKEVIACKYRWVYDFSEGLAVVKEDHDAVYIDKTGKTVINRFYEGESFKEGLAYAMTDRGDYGFINKKGEWVVSPKYNYQAVNEKRFEGGYACVWGANGNQGIIDKTGKLVVPSRYRSVKNFTEGLAAVEVDYDKWGYVDKTGKMVITAKFLAAEKFSDGLAAVSMVVKNRFGDDVKKWGYIDKTGNVVIECQYDSVEPFKNGIAYVKIRDEVFGINRTGEPVRY